MHQVTFFITVIAWIMLVAMVIVVILRLDAAVKYRRNKLARDLDNLNGITRIHPVYKQGWIILLCVAWLVTYYFS